jgi:hypothetical protein
MGIPNTKNAAEMESQTQYIEERLRRHQNSSPTSIINGIACIRKGALLMAHGATILETETQQLREANIKLSKRRQRKRKGLKGFVSRSIADGLQSASQGRNHAHTGQNTDTVVPRQRRCGRCRKPGHRVETCPQAQLATPDNIDHSLIIN